MIKEKKKSNHLYLDANDLHGWVMSPKNSVDGFKWVKNLFKINEDFIKNYDENSNKGYFLEVYVEYLKKLFRLHNDFLFLPKKEKINKCKKLVCNIKDKEKYVVYIRALKKH